MRHTRLAVLFMTALAAIAAALPEQWKHWQYIAPIQTAPLQTPRFVVVTLPLQVARRSRRDWADIRVIDEADKEVPFLLHARLGGQSVETRRILRLEPSFAPGQYSQALIDTGEFVQVHNSVALHVGGTDELLTWVELGVSDDGRDWRVLRERAPIYRLRRDGIDERTTVSYPATMARYLRVRVLDGSQQYALTADVSFVRTTVAERAPTELPIADSRQEGSQSVWTFDPGEAWLPISEVRFDTAESTFYRPVAIDASDDGRHWQQVSSGEILRAVEGGTRRESLGVEFPETTAPHWRVVVHNRSDAPIRDLRPALYATPRRVIVRQEPGHTYRLIYGHSRATTPQYAMSRLTDPNVIESAVEATLGAETINSEYADPAPWTERHESILWIALGAAAVVLGALAIRTLRSST